MRRLTAILFILAVGCQDAPASDNASQKIAMPPPEERCEGDFPRASYYYQISEADALKAEAAVIQFIEERYQLWRDFDPSEPMPIGTDMIAGWEGYWPFRDVKKIKFPDHFDRAYIGARLDGKDVIYGDFGPNWDNENGIGLGKVLQNSWIFDGGHCHNLPYFFNLVYDPNTKAVRYLGHGSSLR
jgi:hypothetical protein